MKVPFALTLSFLVTAVWAGGYQNCLERAWLFQAYLIDQHNPEAQRQIGYQCSNWRQNKCIGNWTPCRGRQGRRQCNFDDFQIFLGNLQPGMNRQTQGVNRPDGSLDITETAKNCIWTWRNARAAPYNFRGYKAVKHGRNNHNDFIYRIGQITNDNYNKPAVKAAAGAQAFRTADDALAAITKARVADHGRHLIPAARAGLPGVTVVEKDMGANPYYRAAWVPPAGVDADPPRWKTVDWEATINNPANPPDTRDRVRGWLGPFYRGPTANGHAKDHWQVLRSYKTISDRTNRCRKH
ncbi:hypothetical protein BT67DRAFT_373008 [Trichocladium antarcticum]|uniref:Uncharacterized protein n=1 Tax=Trichocladium antarcticum TaxID=1450529 RepID=A0AAN6ZHJ0_9PEZI|nr:hypothetical protein BT67DRAFT_373008 [Trichocladium antarcticum]